MLLSLSINFQDLYREEDFLGRTFYVSFRTSFYDFLERALRIDNVGYEENLYVQRKETKDRRFLRSSAAAAFVLE